jgi:hypothetical protein
MAQTCNSSYLSKIKCPFQKIIFIRHIAKVNGEDKPIIFSSYFGRMSFCYN